ncbi:hypothetical protein HPP92_022265 [Vanilla planifolia]|uniref:Cyanobacterial aminoacyl-tRNA synthetase CAAD domain-containing protein n=1 Tax=Vanilla planifolia TaxID=51239 RepID=A0A835PQK5_VANPL|nr:hypothetical protein HPP92_022265 [Vanilla planifolia]
MASATVKATRAVVSLSTRADARFNSCKTAVPPSLPTPSQFSLPSRPPQGRLLSWKAASTCLKNDSSNKAVKSMRKVITMPTGETPTQVVAELPEFVTTVREMWDRLEDKYFVTSLAFASLIALYGSAIDRLPLLPGIFEIIGIGYWASKQQVEEGSTYEELWRRGRTMSHGRAMVFGECKVKGREKSREEKEKTRWRMRRRGVQEG